MSKAAQNQFLVSVGSIQAGYFTTKNGGDAEVQVERDFNGGALTADLMKSRVEYTNVTVSRTFDPVRDQDIVKAARLRLEAEDSDQITVQPVNARKEWVGDPDVFLGQIVKVMAPEYDEQSSARATFSLEFAITSVA